MEHLFHPWHWVPVLAAIPLASPLLYYIRQKWQEKSRCRKSTRE